MEFIIYENMRGSPRQGSAQARSAGERRRKKVAAGSPACGCSSCSGRRGVAGTLLGESPGVGMSELAGEKIGIIISRRKSVS